MEHNQQNEVTSEELAESELGRGDYWRSRYDEELHNFERNPDDVGEIWFGEDIENRIIKYLVTTDNCHKNDFIIDIGCGNGMLLIKLATKGFSNLHGVDYCENAIEFAKKLAKTHKQENIKFQTFDILNNQSIGNKKNTFDMALDKGTYDAISLMTDPKKNRELYIANVRELLKENGHLMLTSCNWTREELIEQFKGNFQWFLDIETPQFKFGGRIGNTVTCIVFKITNINK